MNWLFRYGAVINAIDKSEVVEKWTSTGMSGKEFVGNMKKLYHAVSREAAISTCTFINVNYRQKYVVVKNRILSFSVIGNTLRDLTNIFDKLTQELSKWVYFVDFNMLHFETIGNPNSTFIEDPMRSSILQNFAKNAFQNMKIRWRDESHKNDEPVVKSIKDIIARINKTIMVMVWISTGMPMRFPELTTLTYAEVGRNIFIDVVKRRLYLNVKYNKNHKSTNRILFITGEVSRRL